MTIYQPVTFNADQMAKLITLVSGFSPEEQENFFAEYQDQLSAADELAIRRSIAPRPKRVEATPVSRAAKPDPMELCFWALLVHGCSKNTQFPNSTNRRHLESVLGSWHPGAGAKKPGDREAPILPRAKFYKIRPCHMQNSELGGTHIEFMIIRLAGLRWRVCGT